MKKKNILITVAAVATAVFGSMKGYQEYLKSKIEAEEAQCTSEIAVIDTEVDVLIKKIGEAEKDNVETQNKVVRCEKENTLCESKAMECEQKYLDYHDSGICVDYMKLPPNFELSLEEFIKSYGQGTLSENCKIRKKAKDGFKSLLEEKLARVKKQNSIEALAECESKLGVCDEKRKKCLSDYSAACFNNKENPMDEYLHSKEGT